MLTFLPGRLTTYNLTLNLTGMINLGSRKTVVRPMMINTIYFFLSRKRLPKSNLAKTPKALSSTSISLEVRRIVALSERKSWAANFVQSC